MTELKQRPIPFSAANWSISGGMAGRDKAADESVTIVSKSMSHIQCNGSFRTLPDS